VILSGSSSAQAEFLPPTSGGIYYGPCHYPTDAMKNRRTNLVAQTGQSTSGFVPYETSLDNPLEIKEFCPDAVVNGVPEVCRTHWINRARDLQFNGAVNTANLHCPASMFAAVLVDHSDSSSANEAVDGVNCGVLIESSNGKIQAGPTYADSPESEIIRLLSTRFSQSHINNRLLLNKFSMYSTAEPSSAVISQMVNVGIREVIYGVRIGELVEFGYPIVAIRALDILRRQPTHQVNRRLSKQALTNTLIGQVSHDSLVAHFRWLYNDTAPCPGPCQPYTGTSVHGYRCRGYSTNTVTGGEGQQQQQRRVVN